MVDVNDTGRFTYVVTPTASTNTVVVATGAGTSAGIVVTGTIDNLGIRTIQSN